MTVFPVRIIMSPTCSSRFFVGRNARSAAARTTLSSSLMDRAAGRADCDREAYAIRVTGANREPFPLHRDGGCPWYVPAALGRNPAAQRTIGLRALVPVTVAAIALSGCGSKEQSADEPSGKFPVEIVSASFPSAQRLATTSNLVIVVRNPGRKKIPVISVTVKCKQRTGGS